MLYKTKIVSDGNPSDLSDRNLGDFEPMEIGMEMEPGNKIGVNVIFGGNPTTRIIYLVLEVRKAEEAGDSDTLILFEIGRHDIPPSKTVVKITNSVSMKVDLRSDNGTEKQKTG